MKSLFILFFFISFSNIFGQTRADFTRVIQLAINNFEKDSIPVHEKFKNDHFLNEIKESKSKNVEFKNILFNTRKSKRQLRTYKKNKISNFTSKKLQKSNDKPITYISSPIFTADNSMAIIYAMHSVGGFTGNNAFLIFHKKDNLWELKEIKLSQSWREF